LNRIPSTHKYLYGKIGTNTGQKFAKETVVVRKIIRQIIRAQCRASFVSYLGSHSSISKRWAKIITRYFYWDSPSGRKAIRVF
jgi:hypothetical protein